MITLCLSLVSIVVSVFVLLSRRKAEASFKHAKRNIEELSRLLDRQAA